MTRTAARLATFRAKSMGYEPAYLEEPWEDTPKREDLESASGLLVWIGRKDSNPRHQPWQSDGTRPGVQASSLAYYSIHPVSTASTESVPVKSQ
jgi:hypothetical protein